MSIITIRQLRESLDPSPRTRRLRPEDQRIPANSMPAISHNTDVRTVQNWLNRLPDGWNSPQSPDEAVIQKRGRRKSIVWSPDLDTCKQHSLLSLSSRDRTPIKNSSTPNVTLRDTVRKRLSLIDTRQPEFVGIESKKISLPSQMASNVTSSSTELYNSDLKDGLLALSHEQLVQIVMELVYEQESGTLCKDEELRSIIAKKITIVDIKQFIEKLDIFKGSIYASLELSPNLNDSIHNGTCIHLNAFQEVLVGQGRMLQKSQRWVSLMYYVLEVWKIIGQLPLWDSRSPHNAITEECLKNLSEFSIEAMKNGDFKKSTLETFIENLEVMVEDYEGFQDSLLMAKEAKNKL